MNKEKIIKIICKINCDKRKKFATKICSTPKLKSTQNNHEINQENNIYLNNNIKSVSAIKIRDESEKEELFQLKRESFQRSIYVLPNLHQDFIDRKKIYLKTNSSFN